MDNIEFKPQEKRPSSWETKEFLEGQKKWVYEFIKDTGLEFENFSNQVGAGVGENFDEDYLNGHIVYFSFGVNKNENHVQIKLMQNGEYYIAWDINGEEGSSSESKDIRGIINKLKSV